MPPAKRQQPEQIEEELDALEPEGAVAVAESEDGDVTGPAPEQEEALFRSKGVNFRVVYVKRYRRFTEFGDAITTDGRTIEFAPTGEYRTTDPKEIAYLRSLESLNREFWEVGKEPDAVPSPELIMEKVMQATVEYDDAVLEHLEREEENGYRRPIVLKSIQAARQKVRTHLAALEGE
jgi:hypothetical protein